LAYAVYKALDDSIDKIFVSGELNNSTEGGASENTSGGNNSFSPRGGDAGSVFNLVGTKGETITISGVNNATLAGTAGKRVISVTGGANLVFENITITGGRSSGNGGGIYVSGNSAVKFSGGMITGNQALSGGGVYVEDASPNAAGRYAFSLISGSISGNTATGSSTAPATLAGGGGVYAKGYGEVWLYNGTVSNNTASGGSGGGVLINGITSGSNRSAEYGLLMSGGSISNNKSQGSAFPHGGGGVYVAQGAFEMEGGEVAGNYSRRQGGGVFVHSDSRFTASGNSSILNNEGVGSSKAICSRGYTVMRDNARADKVYIWNGEPGSLNPGNSFTIVGYARAQGIVLAHSADHLNYIDITAVPSGSDTIATIDLEGHLTNGSFIDNDPDGDWLNQTILNGSVGNVNAVISRFPLGAFVGGRTSSLSSRYKLDTAGRLVLR
jgi:hypothetical protein